MSKKRFIVILIDPSSGTKLHDLTSQPIGSCMQFLYDKTKIIDPHILSQQTLASQFNFPRSFACFEPSLRHTNSTSFSKFDLLLDIRVRAWAVVWEVYTSKSSGAEVVVALCCNERPR